MSVNTAIASGSTPNASDHRIPVVGRGISNGFFGQALTFAVRSMQHTVNQLQQWAKEPDLGVKSFASSILLMP